MRILFPIFLLLLSSPSLYAKGEESLVRVCVPQVDLNYLEFQFQIRPARGNSCEANEKELVIRRAENGLLEFVPPEPDSPPSPPKNTGLP